jgi:hypothetical protein
MRLKKLHATLLAGAVSVCNLASAQLVIDNAQFFIQPGATVTVQGDVTSNADILGTGLLQLKGTTVQNVNMNGFTIPNLEIDNTNNVAITTNCKIGTSLLFTNGKIQLGNFNFILASAATVSGAATNKFLETNGTGYAQRNIGNAAASNQLIPVGAGSVYAPVSLTHTGGSYTAALLSAQAKSGKSPNSHIRTESYANVYWPVSTTGVTGGTFTATGTYPADATPGFTGTEADIRGMSFNGTDWSLTGEAHDNTANTVTAQLAANSGEIAGMNRFILMNSKVFLQGANVVAGAMSDGLRSGTNVIPTTEPYRNAPYNFGNTNGGAQEVAAASVFNDLGTLNNVVDWVYLELRNNVTSGTTLLQTRSVFVQRDGDIVDIDGTSPVYFKNLDAGNYTVTVRHRNHMAISTNYTAASYKNLTLSASTPILDFTSSLTNILGVANTNYFQTGGVNMMYAGNANAVLGAATQRVSYSGSGNDASYILGTLLSGNASGAIGSGASPVYHWGDLNFNKRVTYSGSGNDAAYILATPLGSNASNFKQEIKPL